MSTAELVLYEARKVIEGPLLSYIHKKRYKMLRIKMAIKIQKIFRGYIQRHYSYVNLFRMDAYPEIYLCKEQKRTFKDIIQSICKHLPEYQLEEINKRLKESNEFQTLRYPDYSEFEFHSIRLLHYLLPSIKSKVQWA